MRFTIPDKIMRWLGPSVIVGLGLFVLFDAPISRSIICEPEKNCLVSWISATSGWAALVGALATIRVMQAQLAEQRRQTDHLMGKIDPEIYVTGAAYCDDQVWYPTIQITVINRNRRPLEIKKLVASMDNDFTVGVREVLHRDNLKSSFFPRTLVTTGVNQILPGKEDGVAAETCIINCNIYRNRKICEINARNVEEWNVYDFTIEIVCLLRGSEDQSISLRASGMIDF